MGVNQVRRTGLLLFAAVVWLGVCLHGVAAGLPEPFASLYSDTDTVLSEFQSLAQHHPDLLQWTPPDESTTPPSAFQLGVATFSSRSTGGGVSTSQSEVDARPKLVLVFSEHAREVITADTALWLARVLVGETLDVESWSQMRAAVSAMQASLATATLNVTAPSDGKLSDWARQLLQRVTIVMIPVEVPSSRRAVEAGNTCLRKTLTGVDLNRNWPVAWRAGGDRNAEEYGGPAPMSEPQSRALRDLVRGLRNVLGYVQVHSGEWAMYVPWDHTKAEALGLPADTHALLNLLNGQCQCTRGAGGSASNYLAFGTSMDYMWHELGIPYSLTFELYGSNNEGRRDPEWKLNPAAPILKFQDTVTPAAAGWAGRRRGVLSIAAAAAAQQYPCLAMFNPITEEDYRTVVSSWILNFMLLADHIGTTRALPATWAPASRASDPRKALTNPSPGVANGKRSTAAGLAFLCIVALIMYSVLRRQLNLTGPRSPGSGSSSGGGRGVTAALELLRRRLSALIAGGDGQSRDRVA